MNSLTYSRSCPSSCITHDSCNSKVPLREGANFFSFFFSGFYVEERLWWPIQSPNIGRKKKASSYEDREIRSSLLILHLKDGKL